MALRHPFPEGLYPELRCENEPDNPPAKLKAPQEVTFRRGVDMQDVVKKLAGRKAIKLVAAVGSGKSTVVPGELQKAEGITVVHVVPSRLLAVALYDYLVAGAAVPYKLVLEPSEWVEGFKGVVVTYSGAAVARALSVGREASPFGQCILYLDESHESDGYTYWLQKKGGTLAGVEGVVEATATPEAGRQPMREVGEIVSEAFPRDEVPSKWNPHDKGKPWSVTNMRHHSLLFVESDTDAERLAREYSRAGLSVFRLTAQMEVALFRQAMAAMADPNGGIVVLIADYSFRSGFTFDVDVIVDSGLVKVKEIAGGTTRPKLRPYFCLEKYQAQARGGRVEGSKLRCYHPDIQAAEALCRLEGTEVDLAALLFRLMGNAPPMEVMHCQLAKGRVPVDLYASLNGAVGLAVLPEIATMDLVYSDREVSVTEDEGQGGSSPTGLVDDYLRGTPKMDFTEVFPDLPEAKLEESVVEADVGGALRALTAIVAPENCVVVERYYMVPGLKHEIVESTMYGDDVKRLLADMEDHRGIERGWTSEQVCEHLAMLLNAYNTANATARGLSHVAQYRDQLDSYVAMYPQVMRAWAEQVSEKLRIAVSLRARLAVALNSIVPPGMLFKQVPPFLKAERTVATGVGREMSRMLASVARPVEASTYEQSLITGLDSLQFDLPAGAHLEFEQTEGDRAKVALYVLKTKRRGPYKYVAQVLPTMPHAWRPRDYAGVVQGMLDKYNVSSRQIVEVRLPEGEPIASQVLQLLWSRATRKHDLVGSVARRSIEPG